MKVKSKLTKLEKSWVLYDVGNSAFILLASTLLQLFFKDIVGERDVNTLALWGYAGSIATALVAVIGPICGTIADRPGLKKPLFFASVLLGALSCLALGLTGEWKLFLLFYVLAKVGVSSSFVFYDAMLVEVTDPEKSDDVSSVGYACGYIGSVIPFLACLVFYVFQGKMGLSVQGLTLVCCAITSIWWLVCTVPLLLHYKQINSMAAHDAPLHNTFAELANTIRHARKHPNILLYLVAFFFFINGVYTIIDLATSYGAALGLDSVLMLLALLLTQIVAFPATIIFGKLSANIPTGKLMKVCILCYTGIAIFAMFLVTQWQFWLLAGLVGCFQGAIQALSRSYMSKIIPAERSGSYFGLMDICGKGAAFLGSLVVAVISDVLEDVAIPKIFGIQLQNDNIAVGALVVLFIIGFALFCKADKLNQK